MDSQITLVDNLPSSVELTFDLTPNHPTISIGSMPHYSIATFSTTNPHSQSSRAWSASSSLASLRGLGSGNKSSTRTEFREIGTGRLVAAIQRRPVLPDMVEFPVQGPSAGESGPRSVRLGKWMRRSFLSDGSFGSLVETQRENMVWRMDAKRRLTLSLESQIKPKSVSVAHLDTRWSSPTALTLVVQAWALEVVEDIITSFWILVKQGSFLPNQGRPLDEDYQPNSKEACGRPTHEIVTANITASLLYSY